MARGKPSVPPVAKSLDELARNVSTAFQQLMRQNNVFDGSQSIGGGLDVSGTASFTSKVVMNSGLDVSGTASIATLAPSRWPSFGAHKNAVDQSISAATVTKIQFAVEEFDTNGNFDSSANYRFTPTVAGKYLLSAQADFEAPTVSSDIYLTFYKNGSEYKRGGRTVNLLASPTAVNLSLTVDANGTTDYFEVYVYTSTANVLGGGVAVTWFTGCRVG